MRQDGKLYKFLETVKKRAGTFSRDAADPEDRPIGLGGIRGNISTAGNGVRRPNRRGHRKVTKAARRGLWARWSLAQRREKREVAK